MADGSVCVICLRSAYDEAIGVVRPLPLDKPAGERKKAPRTKRETGLAGGMGEPAEGHDYVKPVTRRVKRNKGRRAPRARRAG